MRLLAAIATLLLQPLLLAAQEPPPFSLGSPLDAKTRETRCAPLPEGAPPALGPVLELMQASEPLAVACAELLDAQVPGWHQSPESTVLVVPLVTYLLGDGRARGMERHAVFIDLLGHLEKIEPGWRFDPAVAPLMEQMILGSLVEDPFVANFWATSLQEMDPEWKQSETASALKTTLYQLAREQALKESGPENTRPAELLREISWPDYARFVVAERWLDDWPKRALAILLVLGLIYLAVRRSKRRKKA